jgi:hypothetical protein
MKRWKGGAFPLYEPRMKAFPLPVLLCGAAQFLKEEAGR